MRDILRNTWVNIALGIVFMISAFILWSTGSFEGFVSQMFVAFFNFVIVIFMAIGIACDKVDDLKKKLDEK